MICRGIQAIRRIIDTEGTYAISADRIWLTPTGDVAVFQDGRIEIHPGDDYAFEVPERSMSRGKAWGVVLAGAAVVGTALLVAAAIGAALIVFASII
jgi:hypothetical protein